MAVCTNETAVLTLVQKWIGDLVKVGMSYSRISARLNLSPSTVQKIVAQQRLPRSKTLHNLGNYYLKIFETPHTYGEHVGHYFLEHSDEIALTLSKTKRMLKWLSTLD